MSCFGEAKTPKIDNSGKRGEDEDSSTSLLPAVSVDDDDGGATSPVVTLFGHSEADYKNLIHLLTTEEGNPTTRFMGNSAEMFRNNITKAFRAAKKSEFFTNDKNDDNDDTDSKELNKKREELDAFLFGLAVQLWKYGSSDDEILQQGIVFWLENIVVSSFGKDRYKVLLGKMGLEEASYEKASGESSQDYKTKLKLLVLETFFGGSNHNSDDNRIDISKKIQRIVKCYDALYSEKDIPIDIKPKIAPLFILQQAAPPQLSGESAPSNQELKRLCRSGFFRNDCPTPISTSTEVDHAIAPSFETTNELLLRLIQDANEVGACASRLLRSRLSSNGQVYSDEITEQLRHGCESLACLSQQTAENFLTTQSTRIPAAVAPPPASGFGTDVGETETSTSVRSLADPGTDEEPLFTAKGLLLHNTFTEVWIKSFIEAHPQNNEPYVSQFKSVLDANTTTKLQMGSSAIEKAQAGRLWELSHFIFFEFVDAGGNGAVFRAHLNPKRFPQLGEETCKKHRFCIKIEEFDAISYPKYFCRTNLSFGNMEDQHVVSTFAFFPLFGESKKGEEPNFYMCLVMEECETSLKAELEGRIATRNSGEKLSRDELNWIRGVLYDIFHGLKLAHDQDLLHRDMKPGAFTFVL